MPKELYQAKVKRQTERRVLFACAVQGQFTAMELSKSLKISLPTINLHLEKFQSQAYIKEVGTIGSDLGRKSRLWRCQLTQRRCLSMAVDSHHITMAVFSLGGELFHLKKWPHILGASNFYASLESIIKEYRAALPAGNDNFMSLGISIPGDISFDRKKIIFATNLGLREISIRPLEENLNLKIFLENEANAAALGEVFLDAVPQNDNMLFISVSEKGLGGGLIIEGKLQKGMRRKGGEIGHMSIDLNGIPCSCGSLGCLERYTSQEALEFLASQKGFSLDTLFNVQSAEAEKVIASYCRFLGRGMRNLLSIFDASKICFGGEISIHWERLYPLLYQEIFRNNLFYDDPQDIIICAAKQREHSSLYGAAVLPFIPLLYEDGRFD